MKGLTEEQRLALTLVPSDGSPGDVPDGYAEFMTRGWEMPSEDGVAIEQLAVWVSQETGRAFASGEVSREQYWIELSRTVDGVEVNWCVGRGATLVMAALCAMARWRP